MTATTHRTNDDQYRLVYEGICAVAARCDGARSKDTVGFRGQDTHFGRRIASVPFADWTDDVKEEAARISLIYKGQIESYTGTDVSALDVVREANDLGGTNYAARDMARTYERRQKGAAVVAERAATLLADGRLKLTWNKKDPDCFGTLLAEVRSLPGRKWDGQANVVDFSPEAVEFIERHALAAPFDLEIAKAEAVAVAQEAALKPHITLAAGNRVCIDTPYDAGIVADVRNLPGRKWEAGPKVNTADLHPAVLEFAADHKLRVAADVQSALEALLADQAVTQTQAAILLTVSRTTAPEALSEAFVNQVLAATPKAKVLA